MVLCALQPTTCIQMYSVSSSGHLERTESSSYLKHACSWSCSTLPGWLIGKRWASTCLKRPTKALVYHHISPSFIPDMLVYTVITIVETTMLNIIPMSFNHCVSVMFHNHITFIEQWSLNEKSHQLIFHLMIMNVYPSLFKNITWCLSMARNHII